MYRRYRKHYYHHPKKITKEEIFQWGVVAVVFAFFFIFHFIGGFLSNCIFEWPIRWDVSTCWHEQIAPAKEKAAEKAANFIP